MHEAPGPEGGGGVIAHDELRAVVRRCDRRSIPGALVEAGPSMGSTVVMALAKRPQRQIVVFGDTGPAATAMHADRMRRVDDLEQAEDETVVVAMAHVGFDDAAAVTRTLTWLWPHLVYGGVVAIDNYDAPGCRAAVDAFFADRTDVYFEHHRRLHAVKI
jgi:hypothetical protein